MKTSYFSDTDTLHIGILDHPSAEVEEPVDGVTLDIDADGHVTGITIEHISRVVELSQLIGKPSPLDALAVDRSADVVSG